MVSVGSRSEWDGVRAARNPPPDEAILEAGYPRNLPTIGMLSRCAQMYDIFAHLFIALLW